MRLSAAGIVNVRNYLSAVSVRVVDSGCRLRLRASEPQAVQLQPETVGGVKGGPGPPPADIISSDKTLRIILPC